MQISPSLPRFLPSPKAVLPTQMMEQSSSGHGDGRRCLGWAALDPSGSLSPCHFSRRDPGPRDIVYTITHCGVCYGDLLWSRNGFGHTRYPFVPGHEVVGVVTEIGPQVRRFSVGERVGTGPYVNACHECDHCLRGQENYCLKGPVLTCDGIDLNGSVTRGGFSGFLVADERFCVKIPEKLPSELAAPLLCAGATVYSPMVRHGANQAGKSLGVLGLGGLGHMAVKFGKAFGLCVTVLSTSPSKKEEALTAFAADSFLLTSDKAGMEDATNTLDFIIDTASADHPLDLYLPLLKTGGVFIVVGAPLEMKFTPALLFRGRKSITGSVASSNKETQEMLEFCADHDVTPMIEAIPIQYINTALERLNRKDVRYRFVVDIERSLHSE